MQTETDDVWGEYEGGVCGIFFTDAAVAAAAPGWLVPLWGSICGCYSLPSDVCLSVLALGLHRMHV